MKGTTGQTGSSSDWGCARVVAVAVFLVLLALVTLSGCRDVGSPDCADSGHGRLCADPGPGSRSR
jgi:hypothetical protein